MKKKEGRFTPSKANNLEPVHKVKTKFFFFCFIHSYFTLSFYAHFSYFLDETRLQNELARIFRDRNVLDSIIGKSKLLKFDVRHCKGGGK